MEKIRKVHIDLVGAGGDSEKRGQISDVILKGPHYMIYAALARGYTKSINCDIPLKSEIVD